MAEKTESVASDQGRRLSWSETLVLAAVPVAAYAAAFVYQAGYFGVFGLPLELISIDVRNVFIMIARLIPLLAVAYMLTDIGFMIVNAGWQPAIARRLRRASYLYILGVAMVVIYGSDWRAWIAWLVGLVLLTVLMFAPPLVVGSGDSYFERLEELEQRRLKSLKEEPPSLMTMLVSAVGARNFLLLFSYAFALFVSFQAGQAAAMRRRDFYVASTSPESVVLYLTGDTAVCALFDRKTRDLEPSFSILKLEDHPDVMFRSEEVGPLHVPSPTPSPTPTVVPSPTPTPTVTSSPVPVTTATAVPGVP